MINRDAYESARGLDDKPFRSACYAPYTSLYFNTNGDVIACCKNTTYLLGNVANERLDEIWRGKRVKALRKALDRYKFGLGCEFCQWQIEGEQYGQVYTKTFDTLPLENNEPEWPAMLEFTISNTCNLACIMCYGELSSTIRAQRENLPPLPKVYDDQFFTDLRKYLPHLKVAKFFGGEPFLAQECYRIWDMMIEDGIRIPCHVTTNATQWGPKVERILEHFPVHLSLSLDGTTKETVESVRVNANFEALMENTKRFHDYAQRNGTHMSLTYCLMRQNWHEFGDYLRFGEDLGVDVGINTVIDPVDCSLYTLPPDELVEIVGKMEAQDASNRYSQLNRNGGQWSSALEALRKSANERQVAGVDDIKKAHRAREEVNRPDHLTAAWNLIFADKLEDALTEIRKVTGQHRHAYEAANIEARILRDLGRHDECERTIDRALEIWRKAPNAYVERAWLRLDQNRLEEALADAEKAAGLLTKDRSSRAKPAVAHVLSGILSRLGRHEEALVHARVLLEHRKEAVFYLHRACILELLGRHDEMLADAEAALELEPDNAEAQRLAVVARTERYRKKSE